jgi:uncharacterized protein YecT (DUF1311 family)
MRKIILSFAVMATTWVGPAHAKDSRTAITARYTKAYDECMNTGDAAQGITPAMRLCVSQELDRQDARLNRAYAIVIRRQNVKGKTKLRTLQRVWIKERDTQCRAEADEYEGGTIMPQVYTGCLVDETILRTIWLEKI